MEMKFCYRSGCAKFKYTFVPFYYSKDKFTISSYDVFIQVYIISIPYVRHFQPLWRLDCLARENFGKENYSGKRDERGLFEKSVYNF